MKTKMFIVSKTEVDPCNGDILNNSVVAIESDKVSAMQKMREAYLSALEARSLSDNGGCDQNGNCVQGGCFADDEAMICDYAEVAHGQLMELCSFTCREFWADVRIAEENNDELFKAVERELLKKYAAKYLLWMMFEINPEDYPAQVDAETLRYADNECLRVWGKPLDEILFGEMPEIAAVVDNYIEHYNDSVSRMEQFDRIFARLFLKKKYRKVEMKKLIGNEYISVYGCYEDEIESIRTDNSLSVYEKKEFLELRICDSADNLITVVSREGDTIPDWLKQIASTQATNRDVVEGLADRLNRRLNKSENKEKSIVYKHRIGKYDLVWKNVIEVRERTDG